MIKLFDKKNNCCNCKACMNICPKGAITTRNDENDFNFPEINRELCIECGLCNKVCAFQNVPITGNNPISTYVAINKDKDLLLSSASGGNFGALASIILEKNGVVFGCAYNDKMEPEHVCIDSLQDIKRLQGSKYVQSNINMTYTEARNYLKDDRWVLFTGTPCQIAGLKSYLGKNYENLITVDLICHGVPSVDFFKGYIHYLEDKLQGKVIDFKFRDKSNGWGLQARSTYQARSGSIKSKKIYSYDSYYYNYFLKGYIYRESCYDCKYACGSREGDYTIGDYWGIERAHPEVETRNGVSVLLVNSKKGIALMDELSKYLNLKESTFEQARVQNGQLNNPTPISVKREEILRIWREGGDGAVAEDYYRKNKKRIIISKSKMLIPNLLKKHLKRILKRR